MALWLLTLSLLWPARALDSPLAQVRAQLSAHPDWLSRQKYESVFVNPDLDPDHAPEEIVLKLSGPLADRTAQALAHEYGCTVEKVLNHADTYAFKPLRHVIEENTEGRAKRGARAFGDLQRDTRVSWAEPQRAVLRTKREDALELGGHEAPQKADVLRMFDDPYWPSQWYMHDTRPDKDAAPKVDLRIVGAWRQGFTGKGVVVTIMDDGVQWNHTDLQPNYDPKASYDLNDRDDDPMPRWNDDNKHGTRCAGEVAMAANNSFCGVGIAYSAAIGGLRILDGRITDRLEAEALSFNLQHVDIFSASWGPTDDGRTVDGPGTLAASAIQRGIREGRGGKGAIYVWASGNGGSYGDDCVCDGYADSIYTLSISGASKSGGFPWYGEQCPSTLATAFSSGISAHHKIITTDLRGQCIDSFTGTSAAAPLAAGVVALALEANPELTWRDVQHITVWTSEPAPLFANESRQGWLQNGAHLWTSRQFGFGLLNADAFVAAAKTWKTVPPYKNCTTYFPSFKPHKISPESGAKVRFYTDACARNASSWVRYVEHVQIVIDIEYTRRGNLEIFLKSPQGPKIKMLGVRAQDASANGFKAWPFMSVFSWGENPSGSWELEVLDQSGDSQDHGVLRGITLVLYGTSEAPAHYASPRAYDYLYNQLSDRSPHPQPSERSERSRETLPDFTHDEAKRAVNTQHVTSFLSR